MLIQRKQRHVDAAAIGNHLRRRAPSSRALRQHRRIAHPRDVQILAHHGYLARLQNCHQGVVDHRKRRSAARGGGQRDLVHLIPAAGCVLCNGIASHRIHVIRLTGLAQQDARRATRSKAARLGGHGGAHGNGAGHNAALNCGRVSRPCRVRTMERRILRRGSVVCRRLEGRGHHWKRHSGQGASRDRAQSESQCGGGQYAAGALAMRFHVSLTIRRQPATSHQQQISIDKQLSTSRNGSSNAQ